MGACGGGDRYVLRVLAHHRGGVLVDWNDGGFAEDMSIMGRRLLRRLFTPALTASYTPGRIGRKYCQAIGIPENRIFNAYFSHDVDEYDYRRRRFGLDYRKNIRAHLGIPLGDYIVLNVSRFLDLKRLEDLREALCLVQSQTKGDCHMLLIGDGSYQGPLEAMQREFFNIKLHWVRAVDYEDMPQFYAAVDLLVFPSEGDIWGLVVNEALSMGVPVICTTRIGASEMVREGVDGFVVPPRRADLIAERVLQLYRNRELHESMRRRAVEICQRWNSRLAIGELHRMAEFLGTFN
jgi:glycosyltransferase involved in cell wall biosynthesis